MTPLRASGRISQDEAAALLEATAQTLLGLTADEALAKLDAGELDGTLAGGTLRSLRWLVAA